MNFKKFSVKYGFVISIVIIFFSVGVTVKYDLIGLPIILIGMSYLIYCIWVKEQLNKDLKSKQEQEDLKLKEEKETKRLKQLEEIKKKKDFFHKQLLDNGYIETDTMFFKVKEGYEFKDECSAKTTKVRGVYYNDIYDYEIEEDDEVEIIHNPSEKYFEKTDINCNGLIIGSLMKEMAEEFVQKYGQYYKFTGKIIELTTHKEEDEDDKYIDKVIIQFNVPILRKIKK
ncbi:MAG: hypothetical protein PHP83_03930 [Clostridia bacterium]|nr:hypothetical protein [Clostridia bacterium]